MEGFDDATTRLLAAATAPAPITSPQIVLVVTEGPDAGKRFVIDDLAHRRVLVGTSESCELRLSDRAVSRRHASFELDGAEVRVRDLDSSNGTFVDRVRVFDARLTGGETLRLGSTALRVERGSEQRPLEASADAHFGRFVGASPAVRRLYPRLARLAAVDVPLLFEGEPGTGKELMAEAIHEAGPRRAGPFIVFERDMAGPGGAEALLFGAEQPGLFEQAHGGTLFFDEIGDLELPLQVKLIRVLEKRAVRRVGAADAVPTDVRVIAATRRDLDREVVARRFREELLAHFGAQRIELPPLRKRRGDVALLVSFFWSRMGGDPARLPPGLVQRFDEQTWPGNVRELERAVAHHLVGGEPEPPRAPPEPGQEAWDFIDAVIKQDLSYTRARKKVTLEFDRRFLSRVLAQHGGNVSKAAAASGITRRYFYMVKAKQ